MLIKIKQIRLIRVIRVLKTKLLVVLLIDRESTESTECLTLNKRYIIQQIEQILDRHSILEIQGATHRDLVPRLVSLRKIQTSLSSSKEN